MSRRRGGDRALRIDRLRALVLNGTVRSLLTRKSASDQAGRMHQHSTPWTEICSVLIPRINAFLRVAGFTRAITGRRACAVLCALGLLATPAACPAANPPCGAWGCILPAPPTSIVTLSTFFVDQRGHIEVAYSLGQTETSQDQAWRVLDLSTGRVVYPATSRPGPPAIGIDNYIKKNRANNIPPSITFSSRIGMISINSIGTVAGNCFGVLNYYYEAASHYSPSKAFAVIVRYPKARLLHVSSDCGGVPSTGLVRVEVQSALLDFYPIADGTVWTWINGTPYLVRFKPDFTSPYINELTNVWMLSGDRFLALQNAATLFSETKTGGNLDFSLIQQYIIAHLTQK